MSLEEKLNDAEIHLPGVREKLKRNKGGAWGSYWDGAPQDLEYCETDEYRVVVAKWKEDSWSAEAGCHSGVGFKEWLSVYYRPKGSEREIKQLETEKILTRDYYNPSYDKTHLRPYRFVGVQPLEPARVKVAWVDETGNEGLTYELELK